VWFAYSPDRKGEHPERHLREFHRTLQADAYAGFNQLYQGGRIKPSGVLGACAASLLRSTTSACLADKHGKHCRGSESYTRSKNRSAVSRRSSAAARQTQSKPLLDSLRQLGNVGSPNG